MKLKLPGLTFFVLVEMGPMCNQMQPAASLYYTPPGKSN